VIDDSEVALLHGGASTASGRFTVPQVTVRWSARRWLPPRAATALIEASGRIFYQERTLPRVLELVPPRWRARFRLIDLKAEDARQVLKAARAARERPVRPREPPPSSFARRRRLLRLRLRSKRETGGRRAAPCAAGRLGARARVARVGDRDSAARGAIGGEARRTSWRASRRKSRSSAWCSTTVRAC